MSANMYLYCSSFQKYIPGKINNYTYHMEASLQLYLFYLKLYSVRLYKVDMLRQILRTLLMNPRYDKNKLIVCLGK